MKRKIYFIIIGLILLLAGGASYYFTLKNKEASPKVSGITHGITKVLDERVISPVPAYNNSSIWYFNSEGRLFKANTDGSNLSEFPLPSLPTGDLISVVWPPAGSDFIVLLRSGNATVKSYYDSANKIFINLPANVQWIEWLPDSKRVIYIWQSADKKTQQLVMASPDGSGFKAITSVYWPDLALKASPNGKMALMYRTNAGDINKIYAVDLTSGQIVTVLNQGKTLSVSWLPNGNQFLFTQASITGKSKVYLYDMARRDVTDLNLETTLDRVAVDASSTTLYAAVPNDSASDTFVQVDLTNNKQSSFYEPDANVKVKSLLLVGNTVYFVSGIDGKLYTVGN